MHSTAQLTLMQILSFCDKTNGSDRCCWHKLIEMRQLSYVACQNKYIWYMFSRFFCGKCLSSGSYIWMFHDGSSITFTSNFDTSVKAWLHHFVSRRSHSFSEKKRQHTLRNKFSYWRSFFFLQNNFLTDFLLKNYWTKYFTESSFLTERIILPGKISYWNICFYWTKYFIVWFF